MVIDDSDQTFKSKLYEGIECCFNGNDTKEPPHLHILNDRGFLANLITKALPEIQGE